MSLWLLDTVAAYGVARVCLVLLIVIVAVVVAVPIAAHIAQTFQHLAQVLPTGGTMTAQILLYAEILGFILAGATLLLFLASWLSGDLAVFVVWVHDWLTQDGDDMPDVTMRGPSADWSEVPTLRSMHEPAAKKGPWADKRFVPLGDGKDAA